MAKSGTRSLLYIIVVAALFILSFYFYLVELKLNLNLNVNLKKRSGATWKALLERLNQTEEEETCFLGRNMPNRPLMDMSFVHMIYNKTAVDEIMHPDIHKITILRHPLSNFMSGWRYYQKQFLSKLIESLTPDRIGDSAVTYLTEMELFLSNPRKYLKPFEYHSGAYLFTVNPQMVFFGYPSYLLEADEGHLALLVDSWIYEIGSQFELVLITEEMDTSLAVLMIKFCWSIDDVASFKLNSNLKTNHDLSKQAKESLQRLNWADYRLYSYFKKRLADQVKQIGPEKVENVKTKIIKRSKELSTDCIDPLFGITGRFAIRPEKQNNQTCTLMAADFSPYIFFEQMQRWRTLYPSWSENNNRFCSGNGQALPQMLSRIKPEMIKLYNMATNEFDIRNVVPRHLHEFMTPNTTGH